MRALFVRIFKRAPEEIAVNTWEERKQNLLDRLDNVLAVVDDNPVYEQYTSRNIVNYLTAIKQINGIMKNENRNDCV